MSDKTTNPDIDVTSVDDAYVAAQKAHRTQKHRLRLRSEDKEFQNLLLTTATQDVRRGLQTRQNTAQDRIAAEMSERVTRAQFIADMSPETVQLLKNAQTVLKGGIDTDSGTVDPQVDTE